MNHPLFENINEREWLSIIYSYLNHQINPQPSIPLDHLESLNIEDLDAVTEDMFEVYEYTEDEVKDMMAALSLIIHKKEKE
jgi:hypothetical protein